MDCKNEKYYRDKGIHKNCKRGEYSNDRDYFKKIYNYCRYIGIGRGYRDHYYYHHDHDIACDNCIKYWKEDEEAELKKSNQ